MSSRTPAIGLRIGLFLAAVALLPGIIALVAAGFGGAPTSGLVIAEATGAFSVAALQGLDRRAVDAPTHAAILVALVPAPGVDLYPILEAQPPEGDASPRSADARSLPLRL